MMFTKVTSILVAGAAALSNPALASQPAPPRAAAATEPARPPRASQGDWSLGCEGTDGKRICDAVQSLADQKTNAEVTRMSLFFDRSTKKHGAQVKVPLGVRLDSGAALQLNDSKTDLIEGLRFTRCMPDGCYAEKWLDAGEVARLRAATGLNLIVADLEGQLKIFPHSSKGLATAIDKLGAM